MLELIKQHGAKAFRKLYIWDANWSHKAVLSGRPYKDIFEDPRNITDKYIHKYLIKTQKKHSKMIFRLIDKLIKVIFKY